MNTRAAFLNVNKTNNVGTLAAFFPASRWNLNIPRRISQTHQILPPPPLAAGLGQSGSNQLTVTQREVGGGAA